VHFRGPLVLKQFAVYAPTSQSVKRSVASKHGHRHAHPKLGKHAVKQNRHAQEAKRDAGDWVTATINGDVVSWINQYDGEASCAVLNVSVRGKKLRLGAVHLKNRQDIGPSP
jgi:hypothetical protein